MSGDLPHNPDHNPPLSQALVNGENHLVRPFEPTAPELAPTGEKAGTKGVGAKKETRGITPKAPVTPRPTPNDIAGDPEAYINRHPFDGGRVL